LLTHLVFSQGLLIAKCLTESMGGHITVDSKFGAGTTFSVLIPCIDPRDENSSKKRKGENPSLADPPKLNVKVLVVDDSTFNQTVVRSLLERAGCMVSLASNGEEALQRFQAEKTPFDVILMDLTMPIVSLLFSLPPLFVESFC
jgi:PleD family two-component response regulator